MSRNIGILAGSNVGLEVVKFLDIYFLLNLNDPFTYLDSFEHQ